MIENHLQSMDQSTDDDMVNIQIEESLVRETLMSIDSANFNEDLITILCFAFILIFVFLTGVFGPPVSNSKECPFSISNDSSLYEAKMKFDRISSMNGLIGFSMKLGRNGDKAAGTVKISYKYSIHCHKGKDSVLTIHKPSVTKEFTLNEGDQFTPTIDLFSDSIITYDSVDINIFLDHAFVNFTNMYITYTLGSPEHVVFQMYFRIAFSIIALLFLVSLVYMLRRLEFKLWHLEQKLSVPLLALLIFYNNPFYVIQVNYPSTLFIIFDEIVNSIYHSYLAFFVLVLFDSLRYKNRKTDKCFFAPKVVYVILMLIINAAHGVYGGILSFGEYFDSDSDPVYKVLGWVETGVFFVFVLWAFVSIALSAFQVDVTERYKFNIYLISGVIALLVMGVVQVLFRALDMFRDSSIAFVMRFAAENVFSLLMAYFHWPFEVLPDYNGADGNDQGTPADLFVNENDGA